jgi:hypothetical protein
VQANGRWGCFCDLGEVALVNRRASWQPWPATAENFSTQNFRRSCTFKAEEIARYAPQQLDPDLAPFLALIGFRSRK